MLNWGAGLHGHEYSSHEQRSNTLPRRSSLARTALSSTTLSRRVSTYEDSSSVMQHSPTRAARPRPDFIARSSEAAVALRSREPDMETASEDTRSIAASDISDSTARGTSRRRRSTRSSNAFHLAIPAPTLTQKQRLLKIRPKLLLQLQKLSPESRPRPAIDVVPSTVVVPRLIKKFPRMFRGNAALGANDVMVVRSEEYGTSEKDTTDYADYDDDHFGNRDVVAVICQVGRNPAGVQGLAEIVLSDGSVWLATPLPNGLYEFTSTDERGNKVTARWVRRSPRRGTSDSAGPSDFKFTFSMIDPNSRRHPIMASITNYTLDIPDTYTSVSLSASKQPPMSPIDLPGQPSTRRMQNEISPERGIQVLDEKTKILIQVTGIWVGLRQGLSPYFRYSDSPCASASCAVQRSSSVGQRVRSLTLRSETGRTSPAGTVRSNSESTSSIRGSKVRQTTSKSISSPQLEQFSLPKRTVSNGSAFMQRVTARRNRNVSNIIANVGNDRGLASTAESAGTESIATASLDESPGLRSEPFARPRAPLTSTPQGQFRSQSVYVPTGAQPEEVLGGSDARHSMETTLTPPRTLDASELTKTSRWRSFRDFFRWSSSVPRVADQT